MTQESDEFILRMAEQPIVENMDDESPALLTHQSLKSLQRPKSPSKRKPTFDKGSSCFSISSEKSTLSLMLIGKPGGSFTSMQGEDMTRRSPSFLNQINEIEEACEDETIAQNLTPRTVQNEEINTVISYEMEPTSFKD
jgi:hypothetical protein